MLKSLSVRIAESPRDKTRLACPTGDLLELASAHGFDGISVRASAISIHSDVEEVTAFRLLLDRFGLKASMVTGDVPLAANNSNAPDALRNIGPYLELANALGARLVRVMIHSAADIPYARRAAEAAAECDVWLVQQTHWGSLAESVESSVRLCEAVGRPHFGITLEPANLLACGGLLNADAIRRLAPYIRNVYFQNIALTPDSNLIFRTRTRGPVGVEFLPLFDKRGIDMAPIMSAIARYVPKLPWFTVHQPKLPGERLEDAVASAARFVAQY